MAPEWVAACLRGRAGSRSSTRASVTNRYQGLLWGQQLWSPARGIIWFAAMSRDLHSPKHLMRGTSGKTTRIPTTKSNVDLEYCNMFIKCKCDNFYHIWHLKKIPFYTRGNYSPKMIKVSKFIIDPGFKLGFTWLQSQYFLHHHHCFIQPLLALWHVAGLNAYITTAT